MLEESETFDVSIFRNGLDSDISIGNELAIVTITDIDRKLSCKWCIPHSL